MVRFHWENGLKIASAGLSLDVPRRQPLGFISHAHNDHMARHELALCTPETAALYQLRLGKRPVRELPYRQPLEWLGLRLTTYPAGHVFGSAMLLVEDDGPSLLYTGDFKLGESLTAQRAELPHAEHLVLESTYGTPKYRLPPRGEVIEQLLRVVREAIAAKAVPVIEAYVLGKAQEVTKILTSHGISVMQHRKIFDVSQVYERFGMHLGYVLPFAGRVLPGFALVVPPHSPQADKLGRTVRIAVSGWAVDEGAKYRLGVDHALPLSDHADFDELFEAIARVAPRKVYCTHGPAEFVDHLRDAGFDAHRLGVATQYRLF